MQKVSKNCALTTCYYGKNYGSILTAYALQKLLEKLGYSSQFIKIHKSLGYAKDFNKKYAKETAQCLNIEDFIKLNEQFDTFILGSDNQLDFMILKKLIYRNLFNYVKRYKKKIIIAGSCGNPDLNLDEKELTKIKALLETMDYISFREKSGKEMCKKYFNLESDWILDPVFLIDKEEYINLFPAKINQTTQIMEYILYPNEEKRKIVDYIKKKKNLKINKFLGNEKAKHFSCKESNSVENWLSAIFNSEIVITDSFHCMCFSIIFNKPFICLKNPKGYTRFESIFEMLEINYPVVDSFSSFINNEKKLSQMNFEHINKIIQDTKQKNIHKLKTVLEKNKELSQQQTNAENKIEEFNKTDLTANDQWYKKNRFIYLNFIEPFIEPIVRSYRMKKEAKS